MKRVLVFLSLVVLAGGCATAVRDDGSAEVQIRSIAPQFEAAVSAGDVDRLVGFYADDAVVLPPNEPMVSGSAAIRAFFERLVPMNPTINLTSERIVQSGDLAYDVGHYTFAFTPPGAERMTDRGKYLVVWRRMPNGEWKTVADAFNTDLPMPGM